MPCDNTNWPKNSGLSTLHLVENGKARPLISNWKLIGDIQWSHDRLYFVGMNDKSKSPQVFSMALDGQPVQITDYKQGLSNLKVSPTGDYLAFTMDVKMDPTVNELFKDLPKADARIIDGLMYRHWNAWHDYAYSHVHVAKLERGKAGKPVDLMAGLKADCPLPPFGGAEQFNWCPDGTELALTIKLANNWAESTDSGIYLVSRDGSSMRKHITPSMRGYDTEPVYSPDGQWLAFHSMERPSFESDRNRIMLYHRASGKTHELTTGLDQTVHGATWSHDSQSLLFASERFGTNQIFRLSLQKRLTQITTGQYNWALADQFANGNLLVTRTSMLRPAEYFTLSPTSKAVTPVSNVNGKLYEKLELPTVKEQWVQASDGKQIHNWMILPPGFDPNKKWPAIVYCQGGPQGQIGQWFSYRWNFHLMASQGYVVMAVNRRGLPGFGRKWNDQISKDWGGQAMKDILASTDFLTAQKFVDQKKVAAVGASFGGYTVYWLMGNHQDRFKCMIAHCGVFNLESMYGSTEELFFPNWDLGGPYWKSRKIQRDYDRFSPHRFIKNWKTPLLVIHGEKDFRVPITQGMEAFTAAQVQGVPSRFLYFPNEGHWVLGPQNGVLWHRIFFDWLKRYCK